VTPLDFLKLLWGQKPAALFLLIWTLRDKRSYWSRDIDSAATFVESARGQDVYMGFGLSPGDYGPHSRCASENIAAITGAWADLDLRSDAHNSKPLPRTIAEALSIVPNDLPPSLIVRTGNGLQVWWLFKEPEVFSNSEERQRAVSILARLHTLLRVRAAAKGWSYDKLGDFARIVRIPGTINAKDPANPNEVVVQADSDRRYNLADLEEYLDEAGIDDGRAARQQADDRPDQDHLTINLDAAIEPQLLKDWMKADPRFKDTWLRQRRDLKDLSQSGYDLALANFGVDAGLDRQQIIDLIVQHRRIYAQKARTKLDYYTRTIAAAMDRPGAVDPVIEIAGSTSADSTGQPSEVNENTADIGGGPDPETKRALLYDRVSTALGVQIVGLVKITGQDPSYHMMLANGSVIEFASFAKFTSQESVRNAIGAVTNRLVPKIRPKVWDQIAQAMLDALVEKAGGDETDMKGSTRIHLRRYLSQVCFIDSLDNLPTNAALRPTVLDGKIAISASDLQLHVVKTTGQNLSVKAITSRLAAVGAESIRPRGGAFRDQSRWVLPVEDFRPEDYREQNNGGSDAR
jgi:hypothetical protein